MPELAAKATNNSYYLLTRLSCTPHKIAKIEKLQERACPLCFTELGVTKVNDLVHILYNCMTAIFMWCLLYHTWFKFAGIFINTDIKSYYMLKMNTQIDQKTNGHKSWKHSKFVHMSFIYAHLISRNLVNNVNTTSSWTAMKRLINYYFRLSIKKSMWHKFPPEFFDYDKISLLPRFKQGPPWQRYPIQMTEHLYEKLYPDEERILRILHTLRDHGLASDYDNPKRKPETPTLWQYQLKCNQGMALIASDLNADSRQIRAMKIEFILLWATADY